MEPKFSEKFLQKFKEKVRILDVGPDIWKNPLDPGLLKTVSEAAERWRQKNWKF
jgi:hypothetical protein